MTTEDITKPTPEKPVEAGKPSETVAPVEVKKPEVKEEKPVETKQEETTEEKKTEEPEKPQEEEDAKPGESTLEEKKLENANLECMLFPTYGSQIINTDGQKEWKMNIAGWTYAISKASRLDSWLLAAGRTYGGLSKDTAEDHHFSALLDQFLCETMDMIDLQLRLPGVVMEKIVEQGTRGIRSLNNDPVDTFQELVNSGKTGHFEKEVTFETNAFKPDEEGARVLKVEALFENEEEKPFSGFVDLISPHGFSIISDIDDTIKVTNILDGKEAIIENTFFKTAVEVPHMAEVYSQWATQGVHVHYVSNSPWQVWPALSDFFDSVGFPKGSAHLRDVSVKELVLNQAGQHKLEVIPKIFKDFPDRKFILIGDTGELDPEIYQQVYNQFPDQVLKIFIHDVTTPHAVKVEKEARERPESYYDMLCSFISREAAFLTKGTTSPLAVGAMAQTEVPDEQENISDPDVPLKTKLRQLKDRMERVSTGMRPGVFTVFSDPTTLPSDPVIQEALGKTKN